MTIDWSVTAVYNTIMSVSTGVALLLILRFGKHLHKDKVGALEGWAIGLGIPGIILTITGAHMTLTWPLSKIGFPFDDIIFGEPSLAFGILLLATSVLLWRKANLYVKEEIDMKNTKKVSGLLKDELPTLFKPLSYFAAAMGLSLVAIAIAGLTYQLFAAPPQEPISGTFANYPWVEAIFISALYALTGIGAIIFPFIIKRNPNMGVVKTIRFCWWVAGILFLLFGAMNYFTHIGLIIHTQ